MKHQSVSIFQIIKEITKNPIKDNFAVCWIKNEVKSIEMDDVLYKNVSNSFFL